MTAGDFLIVGLLFASGLLGLMRGFTQELLSIIAFIAAALIALMAHESVHPMVAGWVPEGTLGTFAVIAGLFFITLAPLWFIGERIAQSIRGSAVGFLDRTAGFGFGIVRGLFVLGLAYLIFSYVAGPGTALPSWLREAKLMSLIDSTAELLKALDPTELETDQE